MLFQFWSKEFIFHNEVPGNAGWLYTMAEGVVYGVGRVNYQADTVAMTTLVLKKKHFNMLTLAFLKFYTFL